MVLHSTITPWHGVRAGLLQVRPAAPRPRASLVLCSKAPREEPSLHPRVRRMLEADPHLAASVEKNPRLLRTLSDGQVQGRGGQKQRSEGPPLAALYVSFIVKARSYSEVAALLQSAVSQGSANIVTSGAALDRLRALHASSKQGRDEDLQAAFQLALSELLRRLPDADLRSLATLARAAFHLGLPVPAGQQQRIVAKFVSLMRTLQDSHVAKAKPGALPPKPGWVQIKLSKQGSSAPPGAAVTVERGDGSSDSGSVQPVPARPGLSIEQEAQSISNFVWAILSNPRWQLPDEQLAAVMECVHLQPMPLPLHNTQVLMGLVRYAARHGEAAVRPYTEEGGTAEALLHGLLGQLSMLSRKDCSDTLVSIGRLQLRFPAGSLVALFRQADQLDIADSISRVRSIGMTFFGLSCAYDLAPQECRLALGLPAARRLAQEFAEQVQAPQWEAWLNVVTACCLMRFNPPVGDQQVPLLEMLLRQLPAMSKSFGLPQRLETLALLGQFYGLPASGQVAPELQPHRKCLARLARRTVNVLDQEMHRHTLECWQALRHNRNVDLTQLLNAYSGLS